MQSFRVNIKINSNKVLQSGAYVLVYIAIIYERSEEGPKNVLSLCLLACFLCVPSHLLSLAFLMFLFVLSLKGPQFPCSYSIFQILNTVVMPFSSAGTDYCYTGVGAHSVPWLEYRRAMD